jgi:hypothetical protein
MTEQLRLAKLAAKHLHAMTEAQAAIEELRAEVLVAGMQRKAEIDKMISALEVEVAKHSGHISQMMQKTQQGVDLAQRRSESNLGLGRSKFQDELRAIAAKNRVQRSLQASQQQARLNDIAQAPTRQAQERQYAEYLNGRTATPPANRSDWFSNFFS